MELTKKDLKDLFNALEESSRTYRKAQIEKDKRVKANFKALNLKAKELGKPIPDYLSVIVYLDQPIGMSTYEMYKEWLE